MINILLSLCSGILSGMGIGGGAILIPTLVFYNHLSQQVAQGVNLVCFIPTAIGALLIHIKNKNIDIKAAIFMGISGAAGSVLGWLINTILSGKILQKAFGIFLFCVGLSEVIKGIKSKKTD